MSPAGRMRHLTTADGPFHGRVLAARLGAEGVLVELRGLSEGPYPIPSPVEVFVDGAQLEFAREILIGDAVEEAWLESRLSLPDAWLADDGIMHGEEDGDALNGLSWGPASEWAVEDDPAPEDEETTARGSLGGAGVVALVLVGLLVLALVLSAVGLP